MSRNKVIQSDSIDTPKWRSLALKVVSLLIPFGIYLSILLTSVAGTIQNTDDWDKKFLYENWGTALIIISLVLSLLLIAYFKGAYSIFWAKSTELKLDERQLAVRNRVFLRSYRWFILLFFLAGANTTAYMHAADPRVQTFTLNGLLLLAIALPSILASWNKNA